MSSPETDEAFEELVNILSKEYTNPRAVLNYRILELEKKGKSREEAIQSIYEEEKRRETEKKSAQVRNQQPLDDRVKELEEEVTRLRQEKMAEAERERDFIPPHKSLTIGQIIVVAILSLILPVIICVIIWVMWRMEDKELADQALTVGILASVLGAILYWFLIFA